MNNKLLLILLLFLSTTFFYSQIPAGSVSFNVDFGYFNRAVITPDHTLGLVTDSDNNRVVLFDPRKCTDNIVGSISTGDYPMGIYLTPYGDYACVLNYGDSSVTIINLNDNSTATYYPPQPTEFTTYSNIAITPDGQYGLVANSKEDANKVYIFKISTTDSNLHVTTLPTGKLPVRVYIDAPKNLAFVVCTGKDSNDEITVINLDNFTVDETFSVLDSDFDRNTSAGITRNNMVFSSDGSKAYICDSLYNDLMVIDVPDYNNQGYLDFDSLGYNLQGLSGCFISPDGEHIFCTAIVNDKIVQINSSDYSVETIYYDSTGQTNFDAFNNMVFDSDYPVFYISSMGSDEIMEVNYNSKEILNFLPAGDGPELIYKSNDGYYLCSVNVFSEDVSLFLLKPYIMWVPALRKTDTETTGFAFSNPTGTPSSLFFDAIDYDGYYLNNSPIERVLPPHSQISFLGDQFFGLNNGLSDGWVEVYSNNENISSFFLSFDMGNNYIDGTPGSNYVFSQDFYITHVNENYNQGSKDVETKIFFINPMYEDVTVKLQLISNSGDILKEVEETVNPGKVFDGSMRDIFYRNDDYFEINNCYIKCEIESGDGLFGYMRVNHFDENGNIISIHTLPFTVDNGVNRLYSAHFASGGSFPLPYNTKFNIINTSQNSADITFTLITEDGYTYSATINDVPSGGSVNTNGWELFNLDDPSTYPDYTTGIVYVDSSQNGIIGDVVFGDGLNDVPQFESSLLLDDSTYNWVVFSHVANGSIPDTDLAYATGIAVFNPNEYPINVYVDVYTQDGTFVGEKVVSIDSNDRLLGVISNDYLIPDTLGQLGGYITLYSDDNFTAFELFVDNHTKLLSAVPRN